MPKSYKILGQQAPAANSNVTLYTVPAATQAVISTLAIVNRGTNSKIRVAVVPDGQVLANEHYIEYDRILDSRDSYRITIGISLGAGDRIVIRCDTTNCSFSLFGTEITT